MKKAVLVDFNGVMNKPFVRSNSTSIVTQLKEEICIDRLKMLAELCVQNDAIPISVSSHNSDFIFFELANLLKENHNELYEPFYFLIKSGIRLTPITYKKEVMEKNLSLALKDWKVICFEDNYKFTAFKQLWTNRTECLTQEHIKKAHEYFNS